MERGNQVKKRDQEEKNRRYLHQPQKRKGIVGVTVTLFQKAKNIEDARARRDKWMN